MAYYKDKHASYRHDLDRKDLSAITKTKKAEGKSCKTCTQYLPEKGIGYCKPKQRFQADYYICHLHNTRNEE